MTDRAVYYMLFVTCGLLLILCAFLVKTPDLPTAGYRYYQESQFEMPNTQTKEPVGYYLVHRAVR